MTPVVDTAIYAAGDLVSSKMTFADLFDQQGGGQVLTVLITDKDKQNAALDLVLFGSDPTNTTFTLNAAAAIAAADLTKIIGVVSVAGSDYCAFSANSVACKHSMRLAVAPGVTTIYAALVSRGTPTYSNAANVSVTVGVERG